MTFATVLYEDQRAAHERNFGPHVLVLACVADATGLGRWELRELIKGIPAKGNTRLKATLEQDADLLSQSGPVYAVFDDDQVRTCYGLLNDACVPEVLAAIRRQAKAQVGIVLLKSTIEEVVRACALALHEPPPYVQAHTDRARPHPAQGRRCGGSGDPDQGAG
ncbi:MAG: hypothetical protein HY906_24675 [Deltaproteobacteria bacterium]|nr:hypothetical protein [Deltaproteobacteria bacterium]